MCRSAASRSLPTCTAVIQAERLGTPPRLETKKTGISSRAAARKTISRTGCGQASASIQMRNRRTSRPEHGAIVPVPFALEPLVRIVALFLFQKLRELRVAGQHLLPARPAMIREEIAAAETDA